MGIDFNCHKNPTIVLKEEESKNLTCRKSSQFTDEQTIVNESDIEKLSKKNSKNNINNKQSYEMFKDILNDSNEDNSSKKLEETPKNKNKNKIVSKEKNSIKIRKNRSSSRGTNINLKRIDLFNNKIENEKINKRKRNKTETNFEDKTNLKPLRKVNSSHGKNNNIIQKDSKANSTLKKNQSEIHNNNNKRNSFKSKRKHTSSEININKDNNNKCNKYNTVKASRENIIEDKKSSIKASKENIIEDKKSSIIKEKRKCKSKSPPVKPKPPEEKKYFFKEFQHQFLKTQIDLDKFISLDENEVLFCSFLSKLVNTAGINFNRPVLQSERYCTISKKNFYCYSTKEQFISLSKPMFTIPIENIYKIQILPIKDNLVNENFLLIYVFNNSPSLANCSSFRINESNEELCFVFSKPSDKNIPNKEEILLKWALILEYLINFCK